MWPRRCVRRNGGRPPHPIRTVSSTLIIAVQLDSLECPWLVASAVSGLNVTKTLYLISLLFTRTEKNNWTKFNIIYSCLVLHTDILYRWIRLVKNKIQCYGNVTFFSLLALDVVSFGDTGLCVSWHEYPISVSNGRFISVTDRNMDLINSCWEYNFLNIQYLFTFTIRYLFYILYSYS